MSATRLLVLGVVRLHGQAHGYQVRRELLSWSVDKWASVQPGSIYHALRKLAGEGLLDQFEAEAGGRGPERVAYRLTGTGEAYFLRLLQSMLSEVRDDHSDRDLAAALAFLPMLDRQRAISLLKFRLTQLKGQQANLEAVLEHGGDWGHPEHVNALHRMWAGQVRAAVEWTLDQIERLRAGEYPMADDPEPVFPPLAD